MPFLPKTITYKGFPNNALQWLIAPSVFVKGDAQRRRARFLSAFLLFYSFYCFVGGLVTMPRGGILWMLLLGTSVLLFIAYRLSRTRYYRMAVIFALVVSALPTLVTLITSHSAGNSFESLMWLSVPLVVSSLLLSPKRIIIIATSYIAAIVLIVLLVGLPPYLMVTMVFFIFFLTAIVISITSIRQRDQAEIEAQLEERKRAEGKIMAQKELIDRILKCMMDAVLVVDKDSNIVLANQTFYDSCALEKNAIDGKPLHELIPVASLCEAVSSVISQKQHLFKLEFRHTINLHNKIFIANIISMGEEQVLIVLVDVTEERERRERLYLTDRLASIGEMASGVAHELNNPLTGVIGFSQLLAGEENLPAEMKDDVQTIISEARRAAEVVKNLLAFARKHEPEKGPVQVNKVLTDVLRLRAYEQKVSNIRVSTALDPELTLTLADYFQLQQVFLNIILNSESAMIEANGGGTLSIATKRLDRTIEISFTDDGPGIPKEYLERLFDPFFTTKEIGKGTGLGLSICYGIIDNHNGKIYTTNAEGKGATFTIELPVITPK